MSQRSRIGSGYLIRRVEFAVFVIGCAAFMYAFATYSGASPAEGSVAEPTSTTVPEEYDYSKFVHSNEAHSRLPCLLCHRRDDNSARISFPGKVGHLPCAGCHSTQFADNANPICTICHTNAQTGAMKRFPGLRTFGARFEHARHPRVNCSVCHSSSRRGVAFSIPTGMAAHNSCFRCHSSTATFTMSSCNVCHQPGRVSWASESAKAYNVSFSHARHVTGAGLSCSGCHAVRAGTGTRQVSAPLAAMHFAPAGTLSCAACHNGKRAFGTNDFANCKRCHQGKSFKF